MSMTLSEIIEQVVEPIDQQDAIGEEGMISKAEIIRYVNLAIQKVQALIHTIYEDYFLDWETIPFYKGVRYYSLPSNIYADKIRSFQYEGQNNQLYPKYELKRLRDLKSRLEVDINDSVFRYLITNRAKRVMATVSSYDSPSKTVTCSSEHRMAVGEIVTFTDSSGVVLSTDTIASIPTATTMVLTTGQTLVATNLVTRAGGEQMEISPTPRTDDPTGYKLFYIREINPLINDSDVCEVPEFEQVVILRARYEILKKEITNPMLLVTKEELEEEFKQMVDTLQRRVPDGDTEFIQDTELYGEFYNNWLGGSYGAI